MLSLRSSSKFSKLVRVVLAKERSLVSILPEHEFHTSKMNWNNNRGRMDNNPAPLMGVNFANLMMQQPPPPPPVIVNCGELRGRHSGQYVEMTGRLGKKRAGRFSEIRDRFGVTQLLINDEADPKLAKRFSKVPESSVITIIGRVMARPVSYINESIQTGEIEVEVEDLLAVMMPSGRTQNQKRSYSTMVDTDYKGITSTEFKRAITDNLIRYFDNREFTCNDLRKHHVGKFVQLVGWLHNPSNSKFQQLKDGYGQTQIIVKDYRSLEELDDSSLLLVKGHVVCRPKSNINTTVETGEIEVVAEEVKILDPEQPYDGPIKEKPQPSTAPATKPSKPATTSLLPESADLNLYTTRTHNCGELRIDNVNQNVVLCGWLEYQRMNKFIVLRDSYGQTQIVLSESVSDMDLSDIPFESILRVEGTVIPRPTQMRNPQMKTGDIELSATNIEVLNEAMSSLPIEVRPHNRSRETLRMEHRYIDLRFADMQKNLRLRSAVLMKMREFLINHAGFVEVETPTLFRRTPGGAQEFVVPTRKAGHFYSLVQSPQQFKQMLMAGAIDRYFQIARCYRDEATRPDRQPEFTQLDIELSFTNPDGVMQLIEDLLVYCLPQDKKEITKPFPRMSYNDAMEKYGSDKPDTRFDMTFENVTDILAKNKNLTGDIKDFGAYVILLKKENAYFSTGLKKQLDNIGKTAPCKLVSHKVVKETVNEWAKDNLSKLLSEETMKALGKKLEIKKGNVLLLTYGSKENAQKLLGRIRLLLQEDFEKRDLVEKRKNDEYNFLWIVDFPMFTRSETDEDVLESTHHPFTAPVEEDQPKLYDKVDLENIRSQAYDLVLNGQEIGGGSIRIHNHDEQVSVLDDILKIPHEHLQHLLTALKSGCPPHGGIALGIDRLMAIICNTKSIRDVIAFPKGLDGKDHLSKAPVPISDEEKRLYGLAPSEPSETSVAETEAQEAEEEEETDVVIKEEDVDMESGKKEEEKK